MNGNVEFNVDLSAFPEIQEKIEKLTLNNKDRSILLNSIGALVIQQTQKRFETKVDPDNKAWVNWSAKYKLTRHDGQDILDNTNHLINSFVSEIRGDEVEIKSIEPYASTHNYGDSREITRKTKSGKQSKSFNRNIPQRKFLGINEEDKKEITNTVLNYIERKYVNV